MNSVSETHYDSMAVNDVNYWWHYNRIRMVNSLLSRYSQVEKSSARILDFGCGTGGALYSLQKYYGFKEVLGVDISSTAIRYAKGRGDCYHQIEYGDYDYVDGKDIVLCLDVLEHIEDDRCMISGVLSRMKPGAYFIMTVPAMPRLYSRWDKMLGHYRRYSSNGLRALFRPQLCDMIHIQHFFSYLTPVAFLRKMGAFVGGEEFPAVHSWMNGTLKVLGNIETQIVNRIQLPLGLSLACIVKKRR